MIRSTVALSITTTRPGIGEKKFPLLFPLLSGALRVTAKTAFDSTGPPAYTGSATLWVDCCCGNSVSSFTWVGRLTMNPRGPPWRRGGRKDPRLLVDRAGETVGGHQDDGLRQIDRTRRARHTSEQDD